jgi:hypothetical protein
MLKKLGRFISILIIVLLTLVSCSGEGSECIEEFCVLLELSEPIALNQPFTATITVDPSEDFPDLEISAFADRPNVVFSQDHWTVSAVAGQPIVVTTTVTIPTEGYFSIVGGASYFQYTVADTIEVQMTQAGGTLDPEPYSNPFGLGASHTEGPTYQSPTTEPQPMPFDDYLPNPSPEVALSVCGFSHASPTEWDGAGLSLTYYDSGSNLLRADQIIVGETITIQVDFQAPYDSAPNTRIKLGFCLPEGQTFFDSSDLSDDKKIWEAQADSGEIHTFAVTGQFSMAGNYALPISVFVPNTGEIYSRLPQVLVENTP